MKKRFYLGLILILFFISGCAKEYTIRFETNGGSLVEPIRGASGAEITEPEPPEKSGHTFTGWYKDFVLSQAYEFTVMPESNLTLYAAWKVNTYTITFETNGGSSVSALNITYNSEITLPENPVFSGHAFGGWFLDQDLTEAFDRHYMPAENLTLYAKWSPKTYTISFESNGGSQVSTITGEYDSELNLSEPTRTGYTFLGWYLDSSLSTLFTSSKMPAEYLKLYAKWEVNSYTITFDTLGGNVIPDLELDYEEAIPQLPVPKRPGYDFIGWYSDELLNTPFTLETIPANNLTLYAGWEKSTGVDKEILRRNVTETIQDAVDKRNLYEDIHYELMPSIGTAKILVIPIQFPNDSFKASELQTIEYGFFGDGGNFETLKSYYLKSSYGKLAIDGTVLSPYTAKNNYQYYEYYTSRYNEYASGVDLLIEEAVSYYQKQYPSLNLPDYDTNNDGFLDAIHIVYSAPIEYDDDESIYRAFKYYYMATSGYDEEDYVTWNDYDIDAYVFSGVDFFYEDEPNAWTVIHETGHLLGLDDYYDYEPGKDKNTGGLGGADMMDYNCGDHNPFSKLLLDWIDPIVVEESVVITISPFSTTGDAIVLSKNFKSVFGEYFIISYYTPDGLNVSNPYFTANGLVMYHVNSVLPTNYANISEYSEFFLYNNTDTDYKLIKIVEADGDNRISGSGAVAQNSDLLKAGSQYTLKLYNGTTLCTVKVTEMSASGITLNINFN